MTLDLSLPVVNLTIRDDWEAQQRERVIADLTYYLTVPNSKKLLPRDDYAEAARLTLHVLGAPVPGGFS